ncbi:MAG: N-acetylglucosamine-6-phosphate deacetylase [Oscillospiraceae bacterium]
MKKILIKNGLVFDENFRFIKKDIGIINNRITFKINKSFVDDAQIIDAKNNYIIPGLIDIHIHGAMGADASSGIIEEIETMSNYLAKCGVTTFCPTTMTLPYDVLQKAFHAINNYKQQQLNGEKAGARAIGINMEGPYFSFEKKGAQNPDYIKNADVDAFLQLNNNAQNIVKIIDIAPETEGALHFIEKIKDQVPLISMAHTNAPYEIAKQAISYGANHCTHLFNAMPQYNHRTPGVIGAVFESENITAELICDGVHIHPCVVRNVFKILGNDRVCAISDGLSSTGLTDGQYTLGGQKVYVENYCAKLADGTLAGSAKNLFLGFQNIVSFGISLEDAVKAVSVNPAKAIKEFDNIGSLEENKLADLLILDKNLSLKKVFINGIEH